MVKKIKKEIKNFKWKKIAKKIVCQFGRAVQGGSFRCYSVIGRGFESLNWQNNLFFLFLSLIKNNQKLLIIFFALKSSFINTFEWNIVNKFTFYFFSVPVFIIYQMVVFSNQFSEYLYLFLNFIVCCGFYFIFIF